MKLFDTIDNLLVGAKYLCWAIGLVGIFGSVILFFCNLSLGIASALVFVAALLLSVAVTLMLLPEKLAKGKLGDPKKRMTVGCVLLVLSVALMGVIYLVSGGFPALNLLFI